MSDVSPSWRDSGHSKGYLHFSTFFSGNGGTKFLEKNAGTVQQTASEESGFTGTYPGAVQGEVQRTIARDRNLDDQGHSKWSVFLTVLQIFPQNSGA